jgi:hypothetical protein
MYKISAVVLAVATFSISTSYGADIVIEEKSLSAPIQVKALPTTQPLQSQAITADTTPVNAMADLSASTTTATRST